VPGLALGSFHPSQGPTNLAKPVRLLELPGLLLDAQLEPFPAEFFRLAAQLGLL